MSRALGYLGYRARTEDEMKQYLARRGYPEEIANTVLTRLRDMGYVDDTSYIAAFVEARGKRGHHARNRLRGDLVRRGLNADDVDEALESLDPSHDDTAAMELAMRLRRRHQSVDSSVRHRRMMAALVRRGFSYSTASAAIRRVERLDDGMAE